MNEDELQEKMLEMDQNVFKMLCLKAEAVSVYNVKN